VDTKAKETAPDRMTAAPEPERIRLLQVLPSTSMFAGWGPRMESTISSTLRNRN